MLEEIKDHATVSSESPSHENKSPDKAAHADSTQQAPSGPANVKQEGAPTSDGADSDRDETRVPPDGIESEYLEGLLRTIDEMQFEKVTEAGSIFTPRGINKIVKEALGKDRMQNFQRRAGKPVVCTTNKAYPDGSALELIRNPNGALGLLNWDGTTAVTAEQFLKHDQTYVPPREDSTILHTLRLPAKIADYGSTAELYAEIFQLIARVTRSRAVIPLTFFIFATWLTDCFERAPHVWIVAPPTTASAPLKQMLGLLCRRPLVLSDFSSAGIHSLPMDLQPTILTDVFEPTRRILNLLRTSSRHGVSIAGGKARDAFGAQIVFAPESLRAPASAGFPLELVLSPRRDYTPMMPWTEAERIAEEFQPKLLQYRLLNRANVRRPAFDLGELTVPMQEVAYTLGGSIVGNDEIQSNIVPYLKSSDGEIRSDRSSQLAAVVLDALFTRCHETTDADFPVAKLTQYVNRILFTRGEMLEISPERVGWALRSLGLHTDSMAGGYKRLVLYEEVRKSIHELAVAYGIPTLVNHPADCRLCAALVAEGQLEEYSWGRL